MIGFTCSTFDLLHSGHIVMLAKARDFINAIDPKMELWVGLQTDIKDRPEKNKPIQTVLERYLQLSALQHIERIFPYESETDLLNLLNIIPKHVRFLGEEYVGKNFTGEKLYYKASGILPKDIGHDLNYVVYLERTHNWSTTELRKRIESNETL
jgi:glycerol-3-phosphate cytidylyltransferase